MTGLLPLLSKEWRFTVRTHKLLIAIVLFIVVGLASPLLAALLPTLMAKMPSDTRSHATHPPNSQVKHHCTL